MKFSKENLTTEALHEVYLCKIFQIMFVVLVNIFVSRNWFCICFLGLGVFVMSGCGRSSDNSSINQVQVHEEISCVNENETQTKNCKIFTTHPENTIVKITNAGTSEVTIQNIEFNNAKFFDSVKDIYQEIALKGTEKETNEESLPIGIFNFVRNNLYHSAPFSAQQWGFTPVLFFNSLGFGYCSESAALINLLAKNKGIPSRVWALNGHVVNEILVAGKWGMFDADYGVYFRNLKGEIAGVDDLQSDPELIINPQNRMDYKSNPYTNRYAKLFTTVDDNYIDPYNDSYVQMIGPQIKLPAFATIEFPGVLHQPLYAFDGSLTSSYANLKLTLPAGYEGTIDMSLVIQAIDGDGIVEIGGKYFDIGSDDLVNYLNTNRTFFSIPNIIESTSDVRIVYLINPVRFKMQSVDTLNIYVDDPEKLKTILYSRPPNITQN